SVSSTGVVALKGYLPLADADSHGEDSAVVVGVGVGGVVEEIGKVDVDSVIESPKHLSLRQSETV
nr:hypothetical protein [Tanacetum cinerariifolium]